MAFKIPRDRTLAMLFTRAGSYERSREDCVALVFMQQQPLADVIRIGFLSPKNPGAFAVKDLVGNQVIYCPAG